MISLKRILGLCRAAAALQFWTTRLGPVVAATVIVSSPYGGRALGQDSMVRDLARDPLPPGAVARLGTIRFQADDFMPCVGISPDGKRVAGGTSSGAVILWDADSGQVFRRLHHPRCGLHSLTFSPDGRWLAVGGMTVGDAPALCAWDLESGNARPEFECDELRRVTGVAVSPDGQMLATICDDERTVRLWDANDGREVKILQAPHVGRDHATCVTFSADGRRLAAGADDGAIQAWDLESQTEPFKVAAFRDCDVESVVFARNGAVLLASGLERDGDRGEYVEHIRAFDAQMGQPTPLALEDYAPFVMRGEIMGKLKLVLSHKGDRLAAIHSRRIVVWDLASGRRCCDIQNYENGGLHWMQPAVFSQDDQTLYAVNGYENYSLRRWNVDSGREISTLPPTHTAPVRALRFFPDGQRIVTSADDRTIRIWNVAAAEQLAKLSGRLLCISPDARLAALADDWQFTDPSGRLRIIDMVNHDELFRVETGGDWIGPAAFSAKGDRLAIVSYKRGSEFFRERTKNQRIHVWDVVARRPTTEMLAEVPRIEALAFSASGDDLHSIRHDGVVAIWDTGTGKQVRSFDQRLGADGHVLGAAFSGGGDMLAETFFGSGKRDSTIRLAIFDMVIQKRVYELAAEDDAGNCLAISSDARWLASASPNQRLYQRDTAVRIWNLTTGAEDGRIKPGSVFVTGLAFSADSTQLATGMKDGTVLIWRMDLSR